MKTPRITIHLVYAGLLLALLMSAPPAQAYKMIRDTTEDDAHIQVLFLPFAFNTDAAGFNYGIGGGVSGWPQKQAIVGGAAWKSPQGTDAIYLNLTDFQLPFMKRLFITVHGMEASYDNMLSHPSGGGARPGGNSSDKNSGYAGHGWDQWVESEVSYVLPWGPHGNKPIHTYTTTRGILTDGSLYEGTYDPFSSGRSYFKVKPFYRKRWYREESPQNSSVETTGVRFTWEYDNTDFGYAPTEGSKTMLRLYEGIGSGSTNDWTAIEMDFSSFWSLPESEYTKKQVIGFNFWVVDTPSWDDKENGTSSGESPYYMGATLGGYSHQRGYPFYRFHDKSAYNILLEYRVTPEWSPLDQFQWFKWWEIVPFAEVGRVAPYLGPDTVFKDVKWSTGVGFRTMILNSVLRLDIARSAEGANAWVMVNQTF